MNHDKPYILNAYLPMPLEDFENRYYLPISTGVISKIETGKVIGTNLDVVVAYHTEDQIHACPSIIKRVYP